MATNTETSLEELVINTMDKTTYNELRDAGQINENEIYMVDCDDTDIEFYVDADGVLTARWV